MAPNRKISNAALPLAIVAGTSSAGHTAPAQALWVRSGIHAGARLPLRFPFLHLALLTLGLTFGAVAPVSAQSTGPVSFNSTESALTGTYACNGGAATPIPPVAASTTDGTGSNDVQASNLTASACGLPLYDIASANDASSASDTPTQDDGAGTSAVSQMSLLGGVLTYLTKTESDGCNANTPRVVYCSDTTTVENLYFAGQHITGTSLNRRPLTPCRCRFKYRVIAPVWLCSQAR